MKKSGSFLVKVDKINESIMVYYCNILYAEIDTLNCQIYIKNMGQNNLTKEQLVELSELVPIRK